MSEKEKKQTTIQEEMNEYINQRVGFTTKKGVEKLESVRDDADEAIDAFNKGEYSRLRIILGRMTNDIAYAVRSSERAFATWEMAEVFSTKVTHLLDRRLDGVKRALVKELGDEVGISDE